jgi:hypothetical protein
MVGLRARRAAAIADKEPPEEGPAMRGVPESGCSTFGHSPLQERIVHVPIGLFHPREPAVTKNSSDRFQLSVQSACSVAPTDHSRSTVRVRLNNFARDIRPETYRLDERDSISVPLDGSPGFCSLHDFVAIVRINCLLDQLHQTETALWRREAELAAGVPVSQRPNESSHLSDRLTAILRSATQFIGGVAAGLYMLDEGTVSLELRGAWRLPAERLLESARPLRGATADLEALVGHAVLLKDARLVPDWKIPEDFPAAICVPVSSPTTPLGTLWIFCAETRDFPIRKSSYSRSLRGG